MRLERNSLIAVTLLFMAGCSVNRPARESDNMSDSTDPVTMPMRHADEYDSGPRDYEYEPATSNGDRPRPSRTQITPSAPMREPVPAPPAIGVSRVKSVSWLRGAGHTSGHNNCGDDAGADDCCSGQQTQLPPEYFRSGCGTPPEAVSPRHCQSRVKTTLADMMHGWNHRTKTHRPKRDQTRHKCGEGTTCDPGLIMPEGCNSSRKGSKSYSPSASVTKQSIGGSVGPGRVPQGNHGGSLADPLRENGLDDHGGAADSGFSPDELLDLPSTVEAPTDGMPPQNVPVSELTPAIPMTDSATRLITTPAIPTQVPTAAARQQFNPDTTKQIVQPPMWPRLGPAAATSGNAPTSVPAVATDSALPAIEPGRRI